MPKKKTINLEITEQERYDLEFAIFDLQRSILNSRNADSINDLNDRDREWMVRLSALRKRIEKK